MLEELKEARIFDGSLESLIPPSGGKVCFSGLNQSSAAFTLAEIIRRRPQTFLVYLPTPIEAEDFVRDMEFFWPEGAAQGSILLFPGYEIKPFAGESPSQDLVFARLWALSALLDQRSPLVIAASAPGALQRTLPKKALSDSIEYMEAGEEVDRDSLMEQLTRSGYYPVGMVQSQGDVSVRGGIMDFYPPGASRPVRAEFFGDFVESLRSFRTLDQRSVNDIHEQIILPASEIIYNSGRNGGESTAERGARLLTGLSAENGWLDLLWAPLVEKISTGQFFPGLESFLPLFHDKLSSIHEFAGQDVIRVVFEPDRLADACTNHWERLERHMDIIREEERPHLPLEQLFLKPEELLDFIEPQSRIVIQDLAVSEPDDSTEIHQFKIEGNSDLRALIESPRDSGGLLAPLAARVKAWLDRDLGVFLVCHTKEQARRLAELLEDYSLYPVLDFDSVNRFNKEKGGFHITVGFLTSGFSLNALTSAFITEDELFGPKRRVIRRAVEEVKKIHLSSFQDLAMGDFVVHNDHGIGQYQGLVKLEAGGRDNDYLLLAYKGGDKLYVPVERFGAVGKYAGADDRPPTLDKLGGTSWERVKARVKASIREMADELLKLYAGRKIKSGFNFSERDQYFREFEASFDYDETPDQMRAIDDVLEDMMSDKPMDRLICGDVGYGKTEVALRAAFKAVHDGKQAVVLAPTTILAEQHYQSFSSRMKNYPINVEVLSRFKKPAEQKDILKRLTQGQVDVIVGTHRLLQKDVVFKDPGIIIIDEEHRFGVAAKEKLKKIRSEVDVLALSATPIPRTLQMSLTGIRDLSVIETAPQDRRSIKTYLLKYDEPTVCEAIARELERGGQVFFVHNRVKDIDSVAGRLKKAMPLVRFGVAHGQQKERELEDVMLRFLHREIDVLVTTTIIESGLDFPSANTIIVNNADRFGLAQIYQLRGRVGRSSSQAYAYLLVASPENLTRDARKRLRALLDFSELGAGYKIALHDLQIRGAGNLLGSAQSGQIAAIGYEMYVQLMERTIKELSGEKYVEEIEPEMVLGIPSFIPESYVPDTEQRLVHYRRLSSIKEPDELDEIAAELHDRYGPLPDEVENLIKLMDLKHWLKMAGVKKLELGKGGLTFNFVQAGPVDPQKLVELVGKHPEKANITPEGRLFLQFKGLGGHEGIKQVKNILQGLT